MGTSRRAMLAGVAWAAVARPCLAQAYAVGFGPNPVLPAPDPAHSVSNFSQVVGWAPGQAPVAPPGFVVQRFSAGLDKPRWLLPLSNRDVLVAESAAGRVSIVRDADNDGTAETRIVLLERLNRPFGLAVIAGSLYVAQTDAVLRYPFQPGQRRIGAPPETLLRLPAGGNHWTRNILPSADGTRLFIAVGSSSNVGEHGLAQENRRACILSVALDGSGEQLVASGLRNPVGMAIEPQTGALWTAVNERDMLGDDLVPDYITAVRPGAFYGWPFSYWGGHPDPRLAGQRADLVRTAIAPDYAVGAHTASLGLAFYTGEAFPAPYRGGAFVAQHGSWNRRPFSGYKVIFIPFRNGRPDGPPTDFLTGFIPDPAAGRARGRPVGVFVDATGALLVTDDGGDCIWRVVRA